MNEKMLTFIECYKKDFHDYFPDEKYKWGSIKNFQMNWHENVENDEYANMLRKSLKNDNLLDSNQYYPRRMIIQFAEKDPNTVRKMFNILFNEQLPLFERINTFVEQSKMIIDKYFPGLRHYQDNHAISVYLAYRYPDKYYVYKAKNDKPALKLLNIEITDRNNINELINYFNECNKVREWLVNDKDLLSLVNNSLDEKCYLDDDNHILTWDFLYYLGKTCLETEKRNNIQKEKNIMSKSKITECIIPADPTSYKHRESFNKNGFIDWKQHDYHYEVGDRVYIYSSEPEQYIKFLAEVEKNNMTEDETIDDSEFSINYSRKDYNGLYFRLKLIEEFNEPELLSINSLRLHGLNSNNNLQGKTSLNGELLNYIHDVTKSCNAIYYGGPGCGKSKTVENIYCRKNVLIDENGNTVDNFIRTTFYPDYTNSDFIGQLVPKYNKEDNRMEYIIDPGPFTKALARAYLNRSMKVYLIIEEINRGNASAIFGDVFQLLDRVSSSSINEASNKTIGESEYEISNNIIEEYFLEKLHIDLNGSVKIPDNLSIIATMNTSDQNVYTLDSAFKRRWKMIYMTNKFVDNNPYDTKLRSMYVPNTKCNIKWEDFLNVINDYMTKTFVGINSEDKQIGKYFVGEIDLCKKVIEEKDKLDDAIRLFSEKVLMYLWEDVSKIDHTKWFKEDITQLDDLLDRYKNDGFAVFKTDLEGELNNKSIAIVGKENEQ